MLDQLIGQSLSDRYLIDSLLGRGAMGAVFKAQHIQLGHTVAIKVMSPDLASQPDFRKRFLQEATAGADLNHPGIVRVHDYGEDGALLYMVMEYIPGQNLRHRIGSLRARSQWFELREALMLVRQVCQAVDYAHVRGVLHRDIKPANIMLKPEQVEGLTHRPVLTDLGLAKLLVSGLETEPGQSMGTPAYMSPEQALGRETDARSDVYSLGILLYELTVGMLPFALKTWTEARHHHRQEPPSLPQFSSYPALPDLVKSAILKALKRDPDDRFASAAALAKALAYVYPRVPSDSAPPTAEEGGVSLETQDEGSPVEARGSSIWDEFPTPMPDPRLDRILILAQGKALPPVPLRAEGLTIGRKADNDLMLDDPGVSGHHARIKFDGTDYQVIDLNSTNGTFLANHRLGVGNPAMWSPDKVLRIGKNYLRLERAAPEGGTSIFRSDGTMVEPHLISTTIDERMAIFMEPTELAVEPGSRIAASLTILNQGVVVDHFSVSVVEEVLAEWVSASPSDVRLLPGQQQEVELVIRPPRRPQSRAGEHRLTAQVASQDAPDRIAKVAATVTVAAYRQFSLDFAGAQKQKGTTEGKFKVRVTNEGNADLTVALKAVDPEAACRYTFDPPQAAVPPGERVLAELKVKPTGPLSTAGDKSHLFSVAARSMEDPDLIEQVQGVWIQTPPPVAQFDSQLYPQQMRAGHTAQVKVKNQGQRQEAFSVQWRDRAADLVLPNPIQVEVPPGQEKTVEFRPRLRQPRWLGSKQTHHFTVEVSPIRGEPHIHSGEVVCQGRIPVWPLLLLTFLCAALTGALLLIDREPPIVRIDYAYTGSLTDGDQVTFTATAEDNRKVSRIKIYVDYEEKMTCGQSKCDYTGGPYGVGDHSYYAIAYDEADNEGTSGDRSFTVEPSNGEGNAEISIEVDPEPPIREGECTFLRWEIKDAKEVYLAGKSAAFRGEQEVCPDETTTYIFRIIDLNGNSKERGVTIKVESTDEGSETSIVTGVMVNVAPSTAEVCPHTFRFSADITVKGPVTVDYRWERSDGETIPGTITFEDSGLKMVNGEWELDVPGSHGVRLHVLNPNEMWSEEANFELNCQPDLVITYAEVNTLGPTGGCVTDYDPPVIEVCVQNQGSAPAGPFSIQAGDLTWPVEGLAPGKERCVQGEGAPSGQVRVDVYNEVSEADEDNNVTDHSIPTPPPTCTIINLTELSRSATWESSQLIDAHNGRDQELLPWMGRNDDDRGFVRLQRATLEDGSIVTALETHPKWVSRGCIKGWHTWVEIPPNAVFEAKVGFIQGAFNTDGVTFWVFEHHMENGREVWNSIVESYKKYDGQLRTVRADLSHLAGQEVGIELRVDAGDSAGQDWAVWVDPSIIQTE